MYKWFYLCLSSKAVIKEHISTNVGLYGLLLIYVNNFTFAINN